MSFTSDWQSKTPFSRLFHLALFILLSVSILSLIAALLIIPFYGVNIFTQPGILDDYSNPSVIGSLKLVQIFNAIGMFIVPAVVIAFLNSNKPASYLRMDKMPSFSSILFTVALMVSALPLINFLAEWNNGLSLPESMKGIETWMRRAEDNAALVTEAFLKMDSFGDYLLNLFMIGLLAAVGEELLFRGILQPLMAELTENIHAGIWIAAFLFSAMHVQFFGFFPRMLLGAMFGYIFYHTGSLWIPILAHFVNNGLAVTLSYLSQRGIISEDVDKLGTTSGTGLYVITSFIAASVCFYLISRNHKPTRIFS